MLYALFWLVFFKRLLRRRIGGNEDNHVQNTDQNLVEATEKQIEKDDQRNVIEEDEISIADIDVLENEAPDYEFELDETLRQFDANQNEEARSEEASASDGDIKIPNVYNVTINHSPKTNKISTMDTTLKPNPATAAANVSMQQPKMKIRVKTTPQLAEGRVHSIVVKGDNDKEAYQKVRHTVPAFQTNGEKQHDGVVVEEEFSIVQVSPDESTPVITCEEDNALLDNIDTLSTDGNGPSIKGKPANGFIPIKNLSSEDSNHSDGHPARYRSVSPSICIHPESNVHDGHGGVCLKPGANASPH